MTRSTAAHVVALTAMILVPTQAGLRAAAQEPEGSPRFLQQSWNPQERAWFYVASQGSQIMPYAWFMSLERPDGDRLFVEDGLTRFGYLPNPYNGERGSIRSGLPIGFVKDVDDRGEWIGMTCAACHVNMVELRGQSILVDGGPANADMFAFIEELSRAVALTTDDTARFERFARRVIPRELSTPEAGPSEADSRRLRMSLARFAEDFSRYVEASRTTVPWGPARLDAFGMIFNRATGIDLHDPHNIAQPDAPVSYPFLWDTSWHDRVQWNGSAPNGLAVERLGRNVGEVLGVFAHVDIREPTLPPLWFETSVDRVNLLRIENQLGALTAPAWPDRIAPRTEGQNQDAAAGKVHYDRYCVSCHAIAPTDAIRNLKVTLTPLAEIGTDPKMATNAVSRRARTGILEGVRMPFLATTPPLAAETSSLELVAAIVAGAILAPIDRGLDLSGIGADQTIILDRLLKRGAAALASRNEMLNDLSTSGGKSLAAEYISARRDRDLLVYKARPLNGIWATGPYLHNGSVPNLHELLLPSARRSKTFRVGSRELDEARIGFRSDTGPFLFDTALPGNANTGHEGPAYGTGQLDDVQRRQLLEYLRTL
ncbi:di-heme-cytochrome C peroxidase [Methylobacterium sp. J-048]|uniref:di-heme-cytochrome C peroxidase n=1 Tax=Methylobacterium sp. J-048 TaxID=2836635 RepID=UPI001FB9F1BC|nr:di-heme-cytochrome C peroxidase [Methylobacterium sp. J-048]MCJ2057183.1 di-heme-cytochrome C peroxidase [Methylobacterium sp. J-048]